MAHLSLGLLAYWLVATIRYQLKKSGINSHWSEIVIKMTTQKCVTASVVNIQQQIVSIRGFTGSTADVINIYEILKYKQAPFKRKKSVVTPAEIIKVNVS